MEHLFRWFGLPQRIISDRDPYFTSHFTRELTKGLGINQNLSTAFHPQTDGLSERTNQWVEQYLRLITMNQNEWSKWLPMATAIHNNSRNSTTGFTPNELLVGWEPPLSTEQRSELKNQTAEEYLSNLCHNRLMAIHALNRTTYKTNIPSNQWTIGQLVWLEGKNLLLPYGMAKLAPRCHGPFKITKIISPIAVQLKLPVQWSIHPIFHTSLLTPYTETPSHGPNFTRPPPDLIEGEEEYKVEQIHSHWTWGWRKTLQYLIKWKGYPESDNTWENADQIHAPTLIKLYHQTAAQKTMKAWQIRHENGQSLSSLPFRHHVARLCSLTTKSSFSATIAYTSPLKLAGPTTTDSPANFNHINTVLFVPSHSKTETTLRRTSSINTQPILQQGANSSELSHSPRSAFPICPAVPECTKVTSPSSIVKTVSTSPLHSATSTSITFSVNSLGDTIAHSAQKCSRSVATLRTTSPTSTSSTCQSYTDSSKWRQPFTPFDALPKPNQVHRRSKHPASISSQGSPSASFSSGSPTRSRQSMPMNTNVSASSTIAHSTIEPMFPWQGRSMYVDVHS
jgi:Chromo (CHRromatin Organisation MOdifier) domain